MQRTIESFIRECRQCSTLRHPNVIKFLGIYYPTVAGGANRMRLPVMVMERLSDVSSTCMDKMIGEAEVLRPLVEECLDDDPAVRPSIATICERIQASKDTYMKA